MESEKMEEDSNRESSFPFFFFFGNGQGIIDRPLGNSLFLSFDDDQISRVHI